MPKYTPGHLAGKQKWLVTRYPKPQGELIFLGSILTDPAEPETSLNRKSGAVDIPQEDKFDDSAAVRQEIHSELSTNVSALLKVVPPNSPLFGAGLKAEGRSSHEIKTTVEAMGVSAEIFIPNKSYMDEALGRSEITTYIKDGGWSKSLYMIVGVATASALTVNEEQSQGTNLALSAGASITGTGTETAGEVSRGPMAKGGSKLKTEQKIDFAYRVREFDYLKFRPSGKVKDKGDRNEGAMFGLGGGDHTNLNNEVIVPATDNWVDDDEEMQGMFVLRT